MNDKPRLIEHAFPLKQASLDSVHEKNVRHGHISTLHIWPARRPLAACRAALIASLLPDPSAESKPENMSDVQWEAEIKRRRRDLCEKIGGKVIEKPERKKMPDGRIVERIKEETIGGILHWRREIENAESLEWFRQEILKVYGRAPKVLDPFAGGGAIPLEAMRLGCEATAVDINPVAWFILKCTLEYPQKFADKTFPLPDFILNDDDFMEDFLKKHPSIHRPEPVKPKRNKKGKTKTEQKMILFPGDEIIEEWPPQADLSWHVRAWGKWVFNNARQDLELFYPTYADFEPIDKINPKPYEKQPMQLVPLNNGTPDIDKLNSDFSKEYLNDNRNPRWVAKPTVAYHWARTVICKNCRSIVPLLKTRWLCKKGEKRILLTLSSNPETESVEFGIQSDVPIKEGNTAQKREHDKRIGAGTMSRAGAKCTCCPAIMTMEDIKIESQAGRLGAICTTVVVETKKGKEYRLPTDLEIDCIKNAGFAVDKVFEEIPYGIPTESTPTGGGKGAGRAFSVQSYGFRNWSQLFTSRQLLVMGSFIKWARNSCLTISKLDYTNDWKIAIQSYLACIISRTADYLAQLCVWENGAEEVKHLFMRWALPITWDFAEANPLAPIERFFLGGINSTWRVLTNLFAGSWSGTVNPNVINKSAIIGGSDTYDLVFTDPPYYDAIPYSDLMDFFYIWLRRTIGDLDDTFAKIFNDPLTPKWNAEVNDGELIDDESKHNWNSSESKRVYEDGMYRAFRTSFSQLSPNGHMIVVFANKKPEAWETLVSAVIRAGFCVNGSWPIVTEMPGGLRNLGRASLASSVWLVCKKRPETARPGWDNRVLEEMRINISECLREYWDSGIRGPDFVWAATGPAMEAYSKHPIVKKANDPGQVMSVGEFLSHVRRMVVDFVVGRVLAGEQESTDMAAVDRMDAPTAYYLLHRHDFGFEEAPTGACILYATACGLSDHDLETTWDMLSRAGTKKSTMEEDQEYGEADPDSAEDTDSTQDTGSKVKLKTWVQRKNRNMGFEAPGGQAVPLIDSIHRLMHLWRSGDVHDVDEYLDNNGLRRHELFKRLLQALIELSLPGSEERSLLESLSNHVQAKGAAMYMKISFDEGQK